jgi:predicted Zn-dependent protease
MAIDIEGARLDAALLEALSRLRIQGARVDVRIVAERSQRLAVCRGVVEPIQVADDRGAMITVWHQGAVGYCASANLSYAGLERAMDLAFERAQAMRTCGLLEGVMVPGTPAESIRYATPVVVDWEPLSDLLDRLRQEAMQLQADARIVDSQAALRLTRRLQWLAVDGVLLSEQTFQFAEPQLEASAQVDGVVQTRSLGGRYNGYCQQGGLEVLERSGFVGGAQRVAQEAIALAMAPNCPNGSMHLLLDADQMMLQIHESIGHPLELDRVLGDERNFAGTSFVTPEMFGHYRYGSDLLNVSFDPGLDGEFANYAADDEGLVARRAMLIERGILKQPMGGALSVNRLAAERGLLFEPTASSRAVSWWRAPIDRMANLNIEPGSASLESLIASVDRGILMRTNASWSIDDSRNKFQFGCEWGQLIEKGRLGAVVRNPGYRGVSAEFWRKLVGVGNEQTRKILGTPFCGKGEPGQIIRVGHASPACLFRDVEVFGGAA